MLHAIQTQGVIVWTARYRVFSEVRIGQVHQIPQVVQLQHAFEVVAREVDLLDVRGPPEQAQ